MAIRRFEGATLLEAVTAARSLLGPEAVVLAARQLPASRWPWGRRQPCVRILARAPRERGPDAVPRQAGAALLEEMARLADEVADLRRAVEGLARSGPSEAAPATRRRPVRAVPHPSPTPGSVDPWSRESSNS